MAAPGEQRPVILFPVLVLVAVLVLAAQLWLIASGTAWELLRHHRRARYHPAFPAVVALTLVQVAAVLILGLVVLADR